MYIHVAIMLASCMYVQGRKWWQSGDYPWQVLACCMEITDIIRSDDPSKYITHIPVHQVHTADNATIIFADTHILLFTQDGSCNGLQHYAALGRDYLGGKKASIKTPSINWYQRQLHFCMLVVIYPVYTCVYYVQVNLLPSDEPEDTYAGVAAMVGSTPCMIQSSL